MAFKKRYIFTPIISIVAIIVIWFIYAFIWSMRYNKSQRGMVDNLTEDFIYTTDLIRDPNGYFGFAASVNGSAADTFLLDTQASSLATSDMLLRMKAVYKERKPMPNFNFYGQLYFPKLYTVESLRIGTAELNGVIFNEVSSDNGMYDVIYRPIFGRNILQDFIWKIDNDADSLTVFSNRNLSRLNRYAEGYEKFDDGINNLPVKIQNLTPEMFLVDLGSDYDIIIDKKIYESLRQQNDGKSILRYQGKETMDTVTEFTGIDVRIGNTDYSDCSAVYIPSLDRNIIGQRFLGRCNFILAYEKEEDGYNKEDLYLRKAERNNVVAPMVPNIGFCVGYRGSELLITLVDSESPAAEAGLKPGLKVISLDNGSIPVDIKSVNSGITENLIQKSTRVTVKYTK